MKPDIDPGSEFQADRQSSRDWRATRSDDVIIMSTHTAYPIQSSLFFCRSGYTPQCLGDLRRSSFSDLTGLPVSFILNSPRLQFRIPICGPAIFVDTLISDLGKPRGPVPTLSAGLSCHSHFRLSPSHILSAH